MKPAAAQIVAILKEGEAGVPVAEVCRKHGISSPTLTRMRELEVENARLKC